MGPLAYTSAQEGARRVALSHLDQVAHAAKHLHDSEAVDALHDFRVGMRRFRSCLRAYESLLGSSVGKKTRERLKRVAAATNPGRDAEVQLDWVVSVGDREHDQHKHGVEWLADRLREEKDVAYALVRNELCDELEKIEAKLRKRLSTYVVRHHVGEPSDVPCFGDLTADVLAAQMDALQTELREIRGALDERLAHRARIHGKRLRYLLEPFRDEVEGTKDVVKRLKALQDLLGDLNDLHNLAATVGRALEESSVARSRRLRELATQAGGDLIAELATDTEPGLLAMLTRIQRDRAAMFATLLDEWLVTGGSLDALVAELDVVLARMRGEPDTEIERKYLLLGLPTACVGRDAIAIEQGYLPGERLIERVRKNTLRDKETYVRTVKTGRGLKRIELEETCSAEIFHSLWPHTEGKRVRKRRYRIEEGDRVWEIDEFLDRELWLAEVELPTESATAPTPEWLVPYLVREVTDEPAYVNVNLAQ